MAERAISKQQRDLYLDGLRQGMNRAQAAAHAGTTGSRFRSLIRRDADFAALVEEVSVEGRANFQDILRAEWRDRSKKNDRLFTLELITYLDELSWKRNAGRGAATAEEAVKQSIDVAIESVLDELAARREARAVPAGPSAAVVGNGKGGPARAGG